MQMIVANQYVKIDPVHLLGGGLRQPRDEDGDETADERRDRGDPDHLEHGSAPDHRAETTASQWVNPVLACGSERGDETVGDPTAPARIVVSAAVLAIGRGVAEVAEKRLAAGDCRKDLRLLAGPLAIRVGPRQRELMLRRAAGFERDEATLSRRPLSSRSGRARTLFFSVLGPLAQLVEQGTLIPRSKVRSLHGPSRVRSGRARRAPRA